MSCVKTLKEKGLKLTPQRMLIVDIIHEARGHLTAEEIIRHVQAKMPGVNKSTIYRTLDLLENYGCVYKSETGEGFIYHHSEEGHHHHLVCSKCGRTIKCDEDLFTPLKDLLEEKYNFNADFKHIVMSGLCEKCRNSN
ncbi:MAG: transcriptional repressor [Chloroflexi bacterium RBG_13_51_52]|nr:MAG: transcriptional repressor [Chloroflexi bacterium RBG_13_51_52]